MGKAKRNSKLRKSNNNPTGLISMKEAVNQKENELFDNNTTEMLINKMKNIDVRERECACATLSTISKSTKNCEKIVTSDLLKILSSLLLDPNLRIQETASGALNNITSSLGNSHANILLEADILTPLLAQIKKFSEDLDNIQKHHEIIQQQLNILWQMCESNSAASGILQRENIVTSLMKFINIKTEFTDLAILAAQILNVLSDEDSFNKCFSNEEILQLEQIIAQDNLDDGDASKLYLHVLAAGCVYNLLQSLPHENKQAALDSLLETFLTSLRASCENSIMKVKSSLESAMKVEEEFLEENDKRKLSLSDESITERSGAIATNLLKAQQLSLEVITNMCCPEDGCNDDDLEMGDTGSMSSSDEDAMEDKLSELMAPLSISCEIQTALVNKFAPKIILEKTNFLSKEIYDCDSQQDEIYKDIIKRCETVQSHSLTCVQNMMAVLDPSSIGNKDVLLHLMATFARLLHEAKNHQFSSGLEEDFYEGLTGCFRALLQIFVTRKIYELPPGEVLARLREIAVRSRGTIIKTNVVSLFGKIGIILSRKKHSEAIVTEIANIGNFLLDTAQGSSSDEASELPVIAEAIDSLIDVFSSGKSSEQAGKQILLAHRLRLIEPSFNRKITMARSCQDKEDFYVMQNIHLNLVRFLKYLKKQQNKK